MSMAKTTLATTTIRVPTFIEDVCQNIVRHAHTDISWYIIGDRKTPAEAGELCASVSQKYGIPVTYLDLKQQEQRLADFPELLRLITENTPVRKLIANFLAYLEGCETVIMLDDDNFVTDADLVGLHNIVGTRPELTLVETNTGWYNPYEALIEERNIPLYPRGYPWRERTNPPAEVRKKRAALRVAMNNGFVLEDPDIDAISRLFWPIRVLGMREEWGGVVGLAPGMWASQNNQNTALTRDVIPAYYTPVATGRNSDIWSSYVLFRLVEHMGNAATYGAPLVRQLRNPHNLWRDLQDELLNNRATDQFVSLLRAVPLQSKTYLGALGELLRGALEQLATLTGVPQDEFNMMRDFFTEYQVWQRIMERVVTRQG